MITKEIIEFVAQFEHDPVGFVKAMYPWGEGELAGQQPQEWQLDLLKENGRRDGEGSAGAAKVRNRIRAWHRQVCWCIVAY